MNYKFRVKLMTMGFFAGLGLFSKSYSVELLHLDFNDSTNLGKQNSPLPQGEKSGAVTPSSDYAGSADFGNSGGFIRVPNFRSPRGAFSVEARLKIRSYGPESSRFIADIINTATWDNGPSQGFVFRMGASYLYPPLPRNAYKTEEEWIYASNNNYSHIDRGRISTCLAEFTMARQDDPGDWKQVVTNQCVELNTWVHMVAVWDGEDMRFYLNGKDATDIWRIQGKGHAPLLDSVVSAYVGSRIQGEYDPRHLDGVLDFVRVVDGVMTENEIHQRYKDTFVPEVRDNLCTGVVSLIYPEAGQIVKDKIKFEFKITNHGACTDPDFVAGFFAGDSLEVQLSTDPSFSNIALDVVVQTTLVNLEGLDLAKFSNFQGQIYWRARLKPHGIIALTKMAATTPMLVGDWSLSRPMILDLGKSTGIGRSEKKIKSATFKKEHGLCRKGRGGSSPSLVVDLSGKNHSNPKTKIPKP